MRGHSIATSLKERTEIDRGVHLNFTYGKPLCDELKTKLTQWPTSPLHLLWLVSSKQLLLQALKNEIEAQLNAFEQQLHALPDFIDGHQHLHHFPFIQSALISVYQKKYGHLPYPDKPYVRVSYHSHPFQSDFKLKKMLINVSGSTRLKRKLIQYQIPFNPFFTGVYDFAPNTDYAAYAQVQCHAIQNGTLWMCHPGLASQDLDDPIRATRLIEFTYLFSKAFPELCQQHQIKIVRFKDL